MSKTTNNKQAKFMKTDIKPCIPIPHKHPNSSTISQTNSSTNQKKKQQTEEVLGIDKWKIGNYLGEGSAGRVYKALNVNTGVLAAVKKIMYSSDDLEESRSELKILAKIKHPNVINYFEDYELENQTWIFMEFIPSTLQKFYKSFGPPPYQNFKFFAKQIIEGLDYLHKEKIIHKDIKCSNILIDSRCSIKLSDFGCSKKFEKTTSFDSYENKGNKTFKGTFEWMAPENLKEGKFTRKTDVWSLGCTLLELATGKYPWHEKNFENYMQVIYYIGSRNQIPEIPMNLHQHIVELIQKCLNINPENRLSPEQLLKLPIFTSRSSSPHSPAISAITT